MKHAARSIESILAAAVEVDSEDGRRAFVEQACAGDAELKRRVQELIDNHFRAGNFLELPAADLLLSGEDALLEHPGTAIGRYKLVEQIGEGGFGVVYMAEQEQPVSRKVALKIIKPGMDSKQVVARFEAERQALALMDHPNIAHVLDAGTTDAGRPYFVMELVRGIPITEFCDQSQLSVNERLELFIAVCHAVQHAHQKGIIHRDLKPSNVLVTRQDDGTPHVKVIDFGIAKALGQERLTEKTLCTGVAQMLGTPLYMSPEQAERSAQNTDTRTDIYSLGVLLYELLTGTTPLDKQRLREASYDEIRRMIREEEPAKPSTRLSTLGQAATTICANRKSEPRRLSQLCRGELDWIVMKALEKDRNRRYDTVSALAADVRRYRDDEPVQACPPSTVYRFRKFARRHKAVLMTTAVVALAMLLTSTGLVVSTVLVAQSNQELRQNLYYEHIALAEREWATNNLGRLEQLLDACPLNLRGWEWRYLKRLPFGGPPSFRHGAAVFSAAFSPDGRWLASGGQDGIIKIWDTATGQERVRCSAHDRHVRAVAFSPDGRHLASASWDQTAKIWNFDPEHMKDPLSLLYRLPGHNLDVDDLAFSAEGRYLAVADDQTVRVWDTATHREVPSLPGHHRVAISPDGQFIAAASREATVSVWNVQSGQERWTLRGHSADIQYVAFSNDGKKLASVATDLNTRADGEVKLWDLQTGHEIRTQHGHVGWICAVAFSPDGQRLASAGLDCNIKLWDVPTGREVLTLRGHSNTIRSVAFSRDGNRLVSADHDGSVRIWDARPLDGEFIQDVITLRDHAGGVRSVAFSPDGQYLASAGDDATVKVWDVQRGLARTGNPLIRTFPACKTLFHTVAFSKDNAHLLTSGTGRDLTLWDISSGKQLVLSGARSPGALSLDGRYVIAGAERLGAEYPIRMWDTGTGQVIRDFKGHRWAVNAVVFSPDLASPRIASGSADGTIVVSDVTTGQPIVLPRAGQLFGLAFNRDGRYLASGGRDRTIKVRETKSWQTLYELPDPTGGVECIAFHPQDDRVLAWGSTDGMVKLGNAVTGATITLRGHRSWVEGIAFHPDGDWIASASLDGTVKLWKTPPLAPLAGSAPN